MQRVSLGKGLSVELQVHRSGMSPCMATMQREVGNEGPMHVEEQVV